MMEFRYRAEGLAGPPPPSLAARATYRLRPLVRVRIIGPGGRRQDFRMALLDTGADDTVFPWPTATLIGTRLLAPSPHTLRWRGTDYPLRFANVELELSTAAAFCRWPATVVFSSAPIAYPILGIAGCLEFFDATFRGEDHLVELSPNGKFSGSITIAP
jgi:hypothetical protein